MGPDGLTHHRGDIRHDFICAGDDDDGYAGRVRREFGANDVTAEGGSCQKVDLRWAGVIASWREGGFGELEPGDPGPCRSLQCAAASSVPLPP